MHCQANGGQFPDYLSNLGVRRVTPVSIDDDENAFILLDFARVPLIHAWVADGPFHKIAHIYDAYYGSVLETRNANPGAPGFGN